MSSNFTAVPKNERTYVVIGVGRISAHHQNGLSLGDQNAHYRLHLDREFGVGNYELTLIASIRVVVSNLGVCYEL